MQTHTLGQASPPLLSAGGCLLFPSLFSGRKERRPLLDSCLNCILQLGLPGRSECCGLSAAGLVLNKTDTLSRFCALFSGRFLHWRDSEVWRDDTRVGPSGALMMKSRTSLGGHSTVDFKRQKPLKLPLTCSLTGTVEAE